MSLTLFTDLPPVGIAGLGHAVPESVRSNDDPVYAELRRDSPFRSLFTGYETRRVLAEHESLAELMAAACRSAVASATLNPGEVDLLTGYASVSEFLAPNELYRVHRLLGLPASTETLAVADEFAAFLSGLRLSAERIWLGHARSALVVCGCRWSSSIDYKDPVSVSIGDGAGAALVRSLAPSLPQNGTATDRPLRLVGWNSEVPAEMYGVMRLAPRKAEYPTSLTDPGATTRPLFNMLRESEAVFRDWGVNAPPQIALRLVRAAGVDPEQVTCFTHQASAYLIEAWRQALAPMQVQDTIKELGNMTLASIPVTLSLKARNVETRYVLLLGLGLGVHASACLLHRD